METFSIKRISEDIIFLKCNRFGSNVYIINKEDGIFVIDSSLSRFKTSLKRIFSELNISLSSVKAVFNTHEHYDHIGNSTLFEAPKIMSKKTPSNISKYSLGYNYERNPFEIKRVTEGTYYGFNLIFTPGHTSSGICLNYDNYLIVGDTLFEEGIARTDFPNSSKKHLLNSFKKIKKKIGDKKDLLVLPGHGDVFKLENHINRSIKNLKSNL